MFANLNPILKSLSQKMIIVVCITQRKCRYLCIYIRIIGYKCDVCVTVHL